MAAQERSGAEVASKVIRRIEMTRALHNRLALANIKIKHGWENLSIDAIEPQIDQQLKRKRPTSSADTVSDTSSSISSRFHSLNALASSPIKAPMFSENPLRVDSSHSNHSNHSNHSSKRARIGDFGQYPASSTQNGRKTRSAAAVQSWKKSHKLPESSPVYHTRHTHFPSTSHVSKLSFISEGSTVADDAMSPDMSEDDDDDLPVHSFNINSSRVQSSIQSSPPRTPPPQHRLIDKAANVSWSRTPRTGEEGADLLMYLATSPTPVNYATAKTRIIAPSTPPSKTTPLPSSMMSTPGGSGGLFGIGLSTPSNNFNFADFCNVTPSPAQRDWPKTPKTAKTPLTAREARRKLNFDTLLPPTSGSPQLSRGTAGRSTDLSMELGGALIS
ncbi:hypothetical protein MBLNU459_g4247t1 [Dothideomycetes sp. NU459]